MNNKHLPIISLIVFLIDLSLNRALGYYFSYGSLLLLLVFYAHQFPHYLVIIQGLLTILTLFLYWDNSSLIIMSLIIVCAILSFLHRRLLASTPLLYGVAITFFIINNSIFYYSILEPYSTFLFTKISFFGMLITLFIVLKYLVKPIKLQQKVN